VHISDVKLVSALVLLVLATACISLPSASPDSLADAASALSDEDALRKDEASPDIYDEVDTPELREGNCMTLEEFSASERCLVIVDGKVYDLTGSDSWSLGELHKGGHACGEDHTEVMPNAPHGMSIVLPYYLIDLCE